MSETRSLINAALAGGIIVVFFLMMVLAGYYSRKLLDAIKNLFKTQTLN